MFTPGYHLFNPISNSYARTKISLSINMEFKFSAYFSFRLLELEYIALNFGFWNFSSGNFVLSII